MKKFMLKEGEQYKSADEIEHYVRQLETELRDHFSKQMRDAFIAEAKKQQRQLHDLFNFTQIFLHQQQRKIELLELKVMDKETTKKTLSEHLEDRVIAEETAFREKNKKSSGVAKGYVAVKQTDISGLLFMIKTAKKFSTKDRASDYGDMMFVNEFITALLYKRTLYDRTPIIEGVTSTTSEQIAFRSKFLHDFQTLSQFTGGNEGTIGDLVSKLEQVEGAEKVFAAILAWGEHDIHAANLGVMKVKDASQQDKWILAKIDHGFSAAEFFTDPNIVLKYFADALSTYGYNKHIPLNIDKFKASLDEIASISDEEIETLIKARVAKLKSMGLNITGFYQYYWKDRPFQLSQDAARKIEFSNFQELENYYIDNYKAQMDTMREVSQKLSFLAKIINSIPKEDERIKWQNGGWVNDDFLNDPLAWAEKNRLKIDNIEPRQWVEQQEALKKQNQEKQKSALLKIVGQTRSYAINKDIEEISQICDHENFDATLKLEHDLMDQFATSLQKNNVSLNPEDFLSDRNIQNLEKCCHDISLINKSAFIEDKIDTLLRYIEVIKVINENKKILDQSNRWNITLEIFSILKATLPAKFFSDNIEKQVTAYEQRKQSYPDMDIRRSITELTIKRETTLS